MRSLFAGRRRLTSLAAVASVVLASVVVQVVAAEQAAALPGLQQVSRFTNAGDQKALIQDVSCPEGLQLLGGGAEIYGQKSDKVVLTESWPLNSVTWRAAAQEVYPGWDPHWSLGTYAICSQPLAGWEIKEGNSGPGVRTFKTTYTHECSGGRMAFGAGGRVSTVGGLVGLTMIRPDAPLTIGRASARRVPAGPDVDWWVASYVICAYPGPGHQNLATIKTASFASLQCPGRKTVNGVGGGGGLVDLGPVYLQVLAPRGTTGVNVEMTGVENGGMVAQVTCSD